MATTADAVFNAADVNRDNTLDMNEFRAIVGNAPAVTTYGTATDLSGLGAAGYGSSYQSSSYQTSTGGLVGGDYAYGGAGLGGAGLVGAGIGGANMYESSSYSSSLGNVAGDLTTVTGAAGLAGAGANYLTQTTAVQQYETDAQGLFRDHNPQIVRRPAPQGNVTYTQNIRVRFLQPPPVPPHGPLIIREVRPPQPPAPAPLRIRQQAPPLPTPPPLVLRERPPVPPASMRSETVTRTLAALPVPPRSVIIERIPAAPARPRDIIIERWVPYGAMAARRTIVQRAAAAQQYARPRNVIIQYDAPQVRVIRQFQRLGVTAANPIAYVQTYGAQLLDSQTLVQQARSAGVVEDISPPVVAGLAVGSAQLASSGATVYEGAGFTGGAVALDAGAAGLGGSSYYESSSYSTGTGLAGADLSGAGLVGADLSGAGLAGSSYSTTGYTTTGYSGYAGNGGVAGSDVAFAAADVNQDGVLSKAEFQAAGY